MLLQILVSSLENYVFAKALENFIFNKYRNVSIVRIYLYNIIMIFYIPLYIDYNGLRDVVYSDFLDRDRYYFFLTVRINIFVVAFFQMV